MSKRIDCPTCGATCNANTFHREGCWCCNDRAKEEANDTAFALFMQNDEETRWRMIFDKCLNS